MKSRALASAQYVVYRQQLLIKIEITNAQVRVHCSSNNPMHNDRLNAAYTLFRAIRNVSVNYVISLFHSVIRTFPSTYEREYLFPVVQRLPLVEAHRQLILCLRQSTYLTEMSVNFPHITWQQGSACQ